MAWFSAHVILYVKFKDGRQDSYPVWENIFLVQAGGEEEAMRKAVEYGKQGEGDSSGTFTWGGRPATWVLAGVRKLITCQGLASGPVGTSEEYPKDGTEVSYSQFEVADEESLRKLADGEPVPIVYEE